MLKSNIILAAISFLIFYSAHISPDFFWPAGFITMLIPVVILLNLFFIIFWTIKLSWKIIFSLIIIILGYPYISATVNFSWPQSVDNSNSIKIMSYNVKVFNSYKYLNGKNNANPLKMMDYIKKSNTDIVCLQEFYSKPDSKIFNSIERLTQNTFPYYYFQKNHTNAKGGKFGIAIFSKYPIVKKKELLFDHSTSNQAIYTDIMINKKKVRIYNLHLQSLHINEKEITKGHFDKRSTKNILKILGRLKKGYINRAKQLKVVRKNIEKTDLPILICGDFNDTPYSYNYHLLSENFNNAFEKKGWGIGTTYNGNLAFLRIDNHFYDPKKIRVLEFHTASNIKYSDHYPIWGKYQLY